jgi:hypothetical protein
VTLAIVVAPSCSHDGPQEDACAGIDCGTHGVCDQGACRCVDGYTGPRCDAPPPCQEGVEIDTQEIRALSSSRLRAYFGVAEGFDDGHLYFRDFAVSLPNFPIFDQSAVLYAAPVADDLVPPEMRALSTMQGQRVAVVKWGLNGLPFIFFNVLDDPFASNGRLPPYDMFPNSFVVLVADTVAPARLEEILADLRAVAGTVPVDLLGTIGVITVGPRVDDPEASSLTGSASDRTYLLHVLALAAKVREYPTELSPPEWSATVYPYDWALVPVVPLDETAAMFHPECMRTVTKQLAACAARASSPAPELAEAPPAQRASAAES